MVSNAKALAAKLAQRRAIKKGFPEAASKGISRSLTNRPTIPEEASRGIVESSKRRPY